MNDIAAVGNYILLKLGNHAFHPSNVKTVEACLIGIYHSAMWDSQKDTIVKDMKNTADSSTKRVEISPTSLSMGVNFPDIQYVINWGPPRCLLDYHQDIGRAGRDAITYFYGQQLSHREDDVKDFIKSTTRFRVSSLLSSDHQIQPLKPCNNCCSICKKECPCDICPAYELPFECIAMYCQVVVLMLVSPMLYGVFLMKTEKM